MEIRYSCLCGARNCIPVVKRPSGGTPAFFYCQDCGKPSLDHCLRCGFNAPPGSGHRFCSGCGASADSIQRGVETLDFRREATDIVLGLLCAAGGYYVLHAYFCPWYNAFLQRHMAEYMRYSGYVFLAFISFFVLRILLSFLTGPAWGLLTGTEALPLFWREVALRSSPATDQEGLHAGMRRGIWLRIWLRRVGASLRRRLSVNLRRIVNRA